MSNVPEYLVDKGISSRIYVDNFILLIEGMSIKFGNALIGTKTKIMHSLKKSGKQYQFIGHICIF